MTLRPEAAGPRRTLRWRPSCTSSTRRTQARRNSFGGTCPFTPAPFLDRFPRCALADATSSAAAHAAINRTANRTRHHTPEHAPARWVWPEQRPDEECEASEGVYNCWMEGCIVPCTTQMLRVFGTFCIVAMASNTFGNLLSSIGFPAITVFLAFGVRRAIRPRNSAAHSAP